MINEFVTQLAELLLRMFSHKVYFTRKWKAKNYVEPLDDNFLHLIVNLLVSTCQHTYCVKANSGDF
jgi:hypothetical protein